MSVRFFVVFYYVRSFYNLVFRFRGCISSFFGGLQSCLVFLFGGFQLLIGLSFKVVRSLLIFWVFPKTSRSVVSWNPRDTWSWSSVSGCARGIG